MSMENFLSSLTDEQKQELKSLIEGSEKTTETEEPEEKQKDAHAISEDFTVKRTDNKQPRKRPVKFKKNTWSDTGELRDVDTPEFERTPRRKPAPAKTEIECHVCGKKFKADTRYLSGEFHRCNKCTGR